MYSEAARSDTEFNRTAVITWLVMGAALAAALFIYLILKKPLFYSVLMASTPLVVYVVTHPRVALVQFLFSIFIVYDIEPRLQLSVSDISTVLLLAAAAIDVLLSGRLPRRLPRTTWNYLYLAGALLTCGLIGYWPDLVLRRVPGTLLIVAVLWSVYRLSRHTNVKQLIDWFLSVAAINSICVFAVFATSGGIVRSFGASGVIFDDFVMVATPMALAMYLHAGGRTAGLYLGTAFVCLGGLIATQSRLSILFGLAAVGFVLILAWLRTGRATERLSEDQNRMVRKRIWRLAVFAAVAVILVLMFEQRLFTAVIERFDQLIGGDPFRDVGSARFRAALWKRAVVAWLDHPLFGVGPGGFERLTEIYPTMHIGVEYPYIRGLGTHNMLLEYLATTGILGGLGLLALAGNKLRLTHRAWRRQSAGALGPALALYAWAVLFLVTTLVEAGWTWRPPCLLMAFLAALIARQHDDVVVQAPSSR